MATCLAREGEVRYGSKRRLSRARRLLQQRIEDERFFRARRGHRIAAGIEAVFTAAASSCCCAPARRACRARHERSTATPARRRPAAGSGPGGRSSSPLRPQAASASDGATATASARPNAQTITGQSLSPDAPSNGSIANQIAAATLCRQPVARAFTRPLRPLFQALEPAFGLRRTFFGAVPP